MKLGISDFAKGRHKPDSGYSYFTGTDEELLDLIRANWDKRTPGAGRTDLEKVVLVPVPTDKFVGTKVTLRDTLMLKAEVTRRQPHEDPFVSIRTEGEWLHGDLEDVQPDPVKFVKIVLYSADALLENDGSRSGDFDWEVVAIIASDVENEPMHPLAMARNFLQKPGGTFAPYTAEQFAEAIYYWSTRVSAD